MADRKEEIRQQREVTAGEVFALRLWEVRRRQGWSQQQLSDRMGELGHPMHRVTIAKLEQGGTRSRNVPLEDVLALSYALGVSPLNMVTPFDSGNRLVVVPRPQGPDINPGAGTIAVRKWLRGEEPLFAEDPQFFYSEIPHEEIRALYAVAKLIDRDKVEHGEEPLDLDHFARQTGLPPGVFPPDRKEER